MRPIDADALKDHLEDLQSYTILGEEHPYYSGETNALSVAIQNIDNAPTIDAVPVVRCKDCKHGQPMVYTHAERPCIMCSHLGSGFFARVFNPKWFCADGERRESDG